MSTIQLLRAFVNQRLTVAVEEIIGVFEKTITEYEEEIHRQRTLLRAEQQPGIRIAFNNRTGVSLGTQSSIVNTKTPPQRQDLSPSLDQDPPQSPCIKEEPEEVSTGQEGRQFQRQDGTDIPELHLCPASVKREFYEHTPQTEENKLTAPPAMRPVQQAEAVETDCGGPEPVFDLDVTGFLKTTSNGQFFLSQCFKTESEVLDDDCTQMIGSQPFSVTRKDNDAVSHRVSHSQKKVYECPACSKTFKQNTALQRHITCHTGERPFDCTECSKTFRQKGSLHIHMRKHTGEKPFRCLVCGKNFTQSGTLAAHMRIHTGEKPFSCSVCKKRYNESGTLVRHMRVHTGEKPFICSLCGKRFSEKGNLNKHKRIHTGEKPFSCSVCEKRFTLLSNLKRHKCPGKKSSDAAEQELQLHGTNVPVQISGHTP